MAAVPVKQLPEGPEWLYEVKWDGYRGLVIKDQAQVQIQSRNHKDLTSMYPGITAKALELNVAQLVLDGEIVALDEHGRPAFQALQNRRSQAKHQTVYYGFDLLHLNGCDVTGEPLEKRRALLRKIIETNGVIQAGLPVTCGPRRSAAVNGRSRPEGTRARYAKPLSARPALIAYKKQAWPKA